MTICLVKATSCSGQCLGCERRSVLFLLSSAYIYIYIYHGQGSFPLNSMLKQAVLLLVAETYYLGSKCGRTGTYCLCHKESLEERSSTSGGIVW